MSLKTITYCQLFNDKKSGFALLEVLIALVVMALGMLGIASMLMLSHKANSSSYLKQQAVQIVYNMIDNIRTNSQAAIAGNYNVNNIVATGSPVIPSAPSPNCTSSVCTPLQLATYHTWYWLSQELTRLPNGCGSVATVALGSNTQVTVTVQWDDSPAQKLAGRTGMVPANGSAFVQLSMGTLL